MSYERTSLDYDVALSFAGEDRHLAESLAKQLVSQGISVFYDRYEQADLWGKDLYQHLQTVYRDKASFCVVFLSKAYAQRLWPRHELRQAQARAFRENREYILPLRLDDTQIPGINETTGYLDLRFCSIEQVVDFLIEKLIKQKSLTTDDSNASESLLIPEILDYLDKLADRMAELPTYYPSHLRTGESGKTRFDNIRQTVQIVEDRSAFERWLAEERERIRMAGQDFDRTAYNPTRARLEDEDDYEAQAGQGLPPPSPVLWDERAGERFKRAIILGDPGFGKTWLLRYEARRLATDASQRLCEQATSTDELTLPIFFRFSQLNQSDDPLEDALVALVSARRSDAFRRFVREKLESDRCVILLDAWDEVPVGPPEDDQSIHYEPGYRQRLGERLEDFAREFPQPRLLLTSRIVGYDSNDLSISNLQELELLAFDSLQTESFVSIWFGDDKQAAKQCLAVLRQSPQVRGLARIPLMLTLLCRTYVESQAKQSDFPVHRVQLYDRCLRGLLRDWKEEKRRRRFSDVRLAHTISRLAKAAFELHVQQKEQFTEPELARALGFDLDRNDEVARAEEFIEALKRDGLLITAGEHRDAPLLFLHRTFHEYLTAHMLGQLLDEQPKGWQTEIEIQGNKLTAYQLLDRKAWAPGWQQVIVLLAGRLRDPAPLLKLLSDEKRDDMLRHRLGLAALCLPEISAPGRRQVAELIDEITTALFSLWWEHHRMNTIAAVYALTRALPGLGHVNGRMNGTPLLEHICQYLSSESEAERSAVLTVIKEMGSAAADSAVLDRLDQLLQEEDWEVQFLAAALIGRIGSAAATQTILDRLAGMLSKWWHVSRYEQAAAAIAASGFDRAAASALFDKLLDLTLLDPSWDRKATVEEIVEARICTAAMEPARQEHYLYLVFYESTVRGTTRRILSEMGRLAMPAVLKQLGYWLENRGLTKQAAAIKGISEMGNAAVPGYDVSLTPEAYQTVRAREALLVHCAQAQTPDFIENLVQMLKDPEWETRNAGLQCIGSAEVVPEVIEQLPHLLLDPHPMLQSDALRLVGKIGSQAATQAILDSLAQVLQIPNTGWQSLAVDAIRGIGKAAARDDIIELLWKILNSTILNIADWFAANHALTALCELGAIEPAAMLEILPEMLQKGHRRAAVTIIKGFGSAAAREDILNELARVLRDARYDSSAVIRDEVDVSLILEAIERIGSAAATPGFINQLAQMLQESSRDIRFKAIQAFGRIINAGLTPAILEQLFRSNILNQLARLLQDPDSAMRRKVAQLLGIMMRSGVYFFATKDGIKPKLTAELTLV